MNDRRPPRDERKIHVPAPQPGGASGPPPAPGGAPARPSSSTGSPAPAPGASVFVPAGTTGPPAAARRRVEPASRPTTGRSSPPAPRRDSASPTTRSRRRLPRRPKLRRVLLLLPLLLLLGVLGGYLYAKSVFDRIEKIELTGVLSTGGTGTNYLIVGSDTRDPQALIDAGLDPAGFADGGGDRSDTMLLLRFVDGGARLMSLPRDLYLPISGTGRSQKLNAAYNGGPPRLVATVQESLGLPIHHYMEVDFVSFSKLVDGLGGITIDFPHPAFDRNSGLDVTESGPVRLDGPESLGYVRSRNYTEIIDGREVKDPTADLGRVLRQQQFLKAVFSELGDSRNPIALARAAGGASGGLAIDDDMGMVDAFRLAWRLRSLDPVSVELPVRIGSNEAGSVLFLVEPEAQGALDQFR